MEGWCVLTYVYTLLSEKLTFFFKNKYLGLIWNESYNLKLLWIFGWLYLHFFSITCEWIIMIFHTKVPRVEWRIPACIVCCYRLNDRVSAHSFQKAGETQERGFSGSEIFYERPTAINMTNNKQNPKSFHSFVQHELICLLW